MCRFTSCLSVALATMMVGSVLGDTIVGGPITTDTFWTLENSPYVATQSVLVLDGATLQIDPGVQVRLAPQMAILVAGQLIARGTEDSKIRFTAHVNGGATQADRWGYIGFVDDAVDATFDSAGVYQSGSVLEHTVIEYGGGTGDPPTVQGVISMTDASPYVARSNIRNNSNGGIYSDGDIGDLYIVGNVFDSNFSTWGHPVIERDGGGGAEDNYVVVSDNRIVGSSSNAISVSWGEHVRIEGNLEEQCQELLRGGIRGLLQLYFLLLPRITGLTEA